MTPLEELKETRSERAAASTTPRKVFSGQAPTSPRSTPGKRLLQRRYRELIRKHLNRILENLFAEFTGLHFHIAWKPVSPREWDNQALPSGCSVCCKLSGSPLQAECRTCGPHHLNATLKSDHGHRFTCRLGVRNYWLPVRLRRETLGIAYLQALEHSRPLRPTCRPSAPAADGQRRRLGAIVASRLKFARATRFLQHIVEHVETASLSDLRKADLASAGCAVMALEREQARLHEALHRYVPANPAVPRISPAPRSKEVARGLLERLELDYAKPLTLQRLARDLGMNGAYLSALFSRVVGIPFKSYLTELRLQKAKELLSDPVKTVSEVAYAVGYSSEERLRCVFKKATGLSPSVWRETMRTAPVNRSC